MSSRERQIVIFGATVSGATFHSAPDIMSHLGQAAVVYPRRARLEGRPPQFPLAAAG